MAVASWQQWRSQTISQHLENLRESCMSFFSKLFAQVGYHFNCWDPAPDPRFHQDTQLMIGPIPGWVLYFTFHFFTISVGTHTRLRSIILNSIFSIHCDQSLDLCQVDFTFSMHCFAFRPIPACKSRPSFKVDRTLIELSITQAWQLLFQFLSTMRDFTLTCGPFLKLVEKSASCLSTRYLDLQPKILHPL